MPTRPDMLRFRRLQRELQADREAWRAAHATRPDVLEIPDDHRDDDRDSD